jgi:hypothetical protein
VVKSRRGQPLFKRHGAVLSDPGEFDIDIQIFDADIFRLLENVSATAEIITVDNSTGLYRRTHYLSASLAASIPAWAQVSSWSAVPPLTPIAPISAT